jgi:hypothetical protein
VGYFPPKMPNFNLQLMQKHAQEGCPRCGEIFVCKVNNILQCDCMKMVLTKAQTEYITDITEWEYEGGCLCNNCLEALKDEFQKKRPLI